MEQFDQAVGPRDRSGVLEKLIEGYLVRRERQSPERSDFALRYRHAYEESKARGEDFEIRDQDRALDFGSQYNHEGVDLTLIRESLSLTPLERVRKADKARRDAQRLMSYARKFREKLAGGHR